MRGRTDWLAVAGHAVPVHRPLPCPTQPRRPQPILAEPHLDERQAEREAWAPTEIAPETEPPLECGAVPVDARAERYRVDEWPEWPESLRFIAAIVAALLVLGTLVLLILLPPAAVPPLR